MGCFHKGLPFCDQKGSEKVSLLRGSALGGQNDGRHPAELARSCGSKPHWGFDRCATPQPRLRGYSPLRTPKVWSKNPKAKKCRNDCIFLNAFVSFSRLTPSGPKILYTHTVGADACHRPAAHVLYRRGGFHIRPHHESLKCKMFPIRKNPTKNTGIILGKCLTLRLWYGKV